MTEELRLLKPTLRLVPEYAAMIEESLRAEADRESGYLIAALDKIIGTGSHATFVEYLSDLDKGVGLPQGWVRQSTFWLVRDGRVVGESRLRHELTPSLEIEGGHIGYFIRLSERRKGYGTRILELTLCEARKLSLTRVLVTCNTDNIGSAKIIRKNGGVFDGESLSPHTGKPVSRYWIDLK